jgi:hypothetical protein
MSRGELGPPCRRSGRRRWIERDSGGEWARGGLTPTDFGPSREMGGGGKFLVESGTAE